MTVQFIIKGDQEESLQIYEDGGHRVDHDPCVWLHHVAPRTAEAAIVDGDFYPEEYRGW